MSLSKSSHKCYTSPEKNDTSEIDLTAELVDLEVESFPSDLLPLDESSVSSLLLPDEESSYNDRSPDRHNLMKG